MAINIKNTNWIMHGAVSFSADVSFLETSNKESGDISL